MPAYMISMCDPFDETTQSSNLAVPLPLVRSEIATATCAQRPRGVSGGVCTDRCSDLGTLRGGLLTSLRRPWDAGGRCAHAAVGPRATSGAVCTHRCGDLGHERPQMSKRHRVTLRPPRPAAVSPVAGPPAAPSSTAPAIACSRRQAALFGGAARRSELFHHLQKYCRE